MYRSTFQKVVQRLESKTNTEKQDHGMTISTLFMRPQSKSDKPTKVQKVEPRIETNIYQVGGGGGSSFAMLHLEATEVSQMTA